MGFISYSAFFHSETMALQPMGQAAQLQTRSLKVQKLGELFLRGEWERCHCHTKKQEKLTFGGICSLSLPSELGQKIPLSPLPENHTGGWVWERFKLDIFI